MNRYSNSVTSSSEKTYKNQELYAKYVDKENSNRLNWVINNSNGKTANKYTHNPHEIRVNEKEDYKVSLFKDKIFNL